MNDATEQSSIENAPLSLGDRLRVARENADLSRRELARRLGVSADSVATWEAGESMPRANRLQMLAGMLNVSLRWLLEGGEEESTEAKPATPPPIDAMHCELERLYATLGQAKAIVKHSLDRLADLSVRARRDDVTEQSG